MKPDDSPVHAGHRARMRSRLFETGLSGFQPHEILELILYCSIPKRDVNPLAHSLLDRFGSLTKALSASEKELLSVPGVGERTGHLLRSLDELCSRYEQNRFSDARTLPNVESAMAYSQMAYRRSYTRELVLLFEDRCGKLLTVRGFPGRPRDPAVIRAVLSTALSLHTHSVVALFKGFAPLHRPSTQEMDEISQLIRALSATDIYTVDWLLLSGTHVFSLRDEQLLTDEKNSFHESLPKWRCWLESLHNHPCQNGWYDLTFCAPPPDSTP